MIRMAAYPQLPRTLHARPQVNHSPCTFWLVACRRVYKCVQSLIWMNAATVDFELTVSGKMRSWIGRQPCTHRQQPRRWRKAETDLAHVAAASKRTPATFLYKPIHGHDNARANH